MIAPNPLLPPSPLLDTGSQADGFRLERHKGMGNAHFLLIPGLVPDGPETFLRQKSLFLARGDASIATWPYERFDLEAVMDAIHQFLVGARREKRRPVLVGVSVGGGMVLEYLRRCRESGSRPDVFGVVLVSPLTTPDDLAGLLKRLWKPIVSDQGEPVQALEKGRAFFRQLASKSSGNGKPVESWMSFLSALTPAGIGERVDAGIRKRIEKTLSRIPAEGAIQRCRALRELPGLDAGDNARAPLTEAPTLILWGSKERHTLDMNGPGTAVLCRPDLAERHFKNAEIHWIYTKDGDPVPHASLLKHHKAFRKPLKRFLKRL